MDATFLLIAAALLAAVALGAVAVARRKPAPAQPAAPAPPAALPADPPAGSATFTGGPITASRVLNVAGSLGAYYEAPLPVAVAGVTLPQRKRFVGRVELLATLRERLQTDAAVSVTSLKGIAGVGKSALALETAHRCADLFPDGRYWVDLRGGDAEQALRTLLLELGVVQPQQLAGGFAVLCALVRGQLAGRRVLLVLDNAEEIARRDPAQLHAMCLPPPARTLITSRMMVGADDLRIDVLEEADALALLAASGVDVTGDPAAARDLVQRLGRLALALDITARRMAISTPRQRCADALAELNALPTVLDGLRLPLHNTVDDNAALSFALTYEQLDGELRAAFHALGQCAPGGAGVAGVAAMLGVAPADAQSRLRALAILSLAAYDGRRAELHPLLHAYAQVCAAQDSAAVATLQERHANYYGRELGGRYQQAISQDSDRSEALLEIDAEYDNVLLAQRRALTPGFSQPVLAVDLTDELSQYWLLRDVNALRDWLQSAIVLANRLGKKVRAANCIQRLGVVHVQLAEYPDARQRYEQALPIFREIGDRLGAANCILSLGDVHVRLAEYPDARQRYEQALPIYTEIGARLGAANCIQRLGDVHVQLAEYPDARQRYEQALPIYTEIGDRLGAANCIKSLGDVHVQLDEYPDARQRYEQALPIYTAIGQVLGQMICRRGLADLARQEQRFEAARAMYLQAIEYYQTTGMAHNEAFLWQRLAYTARDSGDTAEARRCFGQALSIWQRIGSPSANKVSVEMAALDSH